MSMCHKNVAVSSDGSNEENHLPHFRKSDVIDDVTVTSWVGDDVTW